MRQRGLVSVVLMAVLGGCSVGEVPIDAHMVVQRCPSSLGVSSCELACADPHQTEASRPCSPAIGADGAMSSCVATFEFEDGMRGCCVVSGTAALYLECQPQDAGANAP